MPQIIERLHDLGEFQAERIGQGNHILAYPDPRKYTNSLVTMTGADVILNLHVPYFHRINRIVIIQLSSVFTESSNPLDIKFEVKQGHSKISKYMFETLISEVNSVTSESEYKFGEGFEYEPRNWSLTLNGTSTDVVIPVIWLQNLGV